MSTPTGSRLDGAAWRKSSYSSGSGNCIEVAASAPAWAAMRDSKNTAGPALVVAATEFDRFVAAARR